MGGISWRRFGLGAVWGGPDGEKKGEQEPAGEREGEKREIDRDRDRQRHDKTRQSRAVKRLQVRVRNGLPVRPVTGLAPTGGLACGYRVS